MQDLNIAFVQTDIVWHNAAQNRILFSEKIKSISKKVDLIILPEMFTTGFTMKPSDVAEKMNGDTIKWMQNLASKNGFAISGSLVIEEKNKFFNRFVFVLPSGEIKMYDKRHLFSLAGEEKVYTKGNSKVIIEYKGWKICPQICYDLRFPAFSRNTKNYDLLLYVANWPKPRIDAWDTLLKARAIENMCYVVGVNRIGIDSNNLEYTGHSSVFDCLGNQEGIENNENECVKVIKLHKHQIEQNRKKLNFLADQDKFTLLF